MDDGVEDWSLLHEILDPEVTWTLPGNNQISGTVAGVDGVVGQVELISSYGLTFTPLHVLVSRDNVALNLHNTARRGELVLDEHLATVCTLRDGRVVTIETYLSDVEGMNAFFADLPDLESGRAEFHAEVTVADGVGLAAAPS